MTTTRATVLLALPLVACSAAKKPGPPLARFSGDIQALALAARYVPPAPVILEAGSFHGETALEMVRRWPQATVYSFEPVPELLAIVMQNTAPFPNIHPSALALSDRVGTAVFHLAATADKPNQTLGSGSLLESSHHREGFPAIEFAKDITVSTTTIDAWAKASGVPRLDLLWLDIQGAEFPVLKNATTLLKTVSVVVTEVEFVEMYRGQVLFAEMKPWFEAQGFVLMAADFSPEAPDRADLKSRNPLSWYGNAMFVRQAVAHGPRI
jgi:FkbM family methyltransferase